MFFNLEVLYLDFSSSFLLNINMGVGLKIGGDTSQVYMGWQGRGFNLWQILNYS